MRRSSLVIVLLSAASCTDAAPIEEEALELEVAPVTCPPTLQRYPVAGPHNGGYDNNALNYTCPPHPGSSPDGSDFGGDHYGNDIFAAKGTRLVAPRTGTVVRAGYSGISGLRVTIRDACGWSYFHAHMDQLAPGIAAGVQVQAGDYIGTVGNTGNAAFTSPHLHFSIFPGDDYEGGIDPFALLQTVDHTACAGCTPHCEGSVIVDAGCGQGDCGAFGLTCVMQDGAPTCGAGCAPHCEGSVVVSADCGRGDCGAFGAACVMQDGAPGCVLSCTPHCEGTETVAADCSRGDCGAFGAACAMQGGQPTCVLSCTPHCEGTETVAADCSRGDCGAFGLTCAMQGGSPTCVEVGCTPHCEGTVMVGADCGRGDCGAFGAYCVMEGGQPTCKADCVPHCEGDIAVDASCGRGDCRAFGAYCDTGAQNGVYVPECKTGCRPHCEGTVIVDAQCGRGDCGAFGVQCIVNELGKPTCGYPPPCVHRCDGDTIIMSDCSVGNCGTFGLTCGNFGAGPHCTVPACQPHCEGSVMVDAGCNRGDCGAFGLSCSTYGGSPPHCVFAGCLNAAGAPVARDICYAGTRWQCDATGFAEEIPCPAGQPCNACAGCGPVPAEACNYVDDDCDGDTDEGVRNKCGTCGAVPAETCNYLDDDCDGATDEGLKNACGACGVVPAETCNYRDDDCDGVVDDGVQNACGNCEAIPAETCNYRDDDCDGDTDEDFVTLGQVCSAGLGACQTSGTVRCAPGGGVACAAVAGAAGEERCNGVDDDCDGEADDGLGLGDVCFVGEGACRVQGVIACRDDDSGEAACVPQARACDDGDPCTADGCGVNGCTHTAIDTCCAGRDSVCAGGEVCREGRCEALLCAPCADSDDCGGAPCLNYPAGRACAAPCSAGTCPPRFACVAANSDGRAASQLVCASDDAVCCPVGTEPFQGGCRPVGTGVEPGPEESPETAPEATAEAPAEGTTIEPAPEPGPEATAEATTEATATATTDTGGTGGTGDTGGGGGSDTSVSGKSEDDGCGAGGAGLPLWVIGVLLFGRRRGR